MKTTDRAEFVKTLNLCYSTLLKPLPTLESLLLWERLLEPYSIEQVCTALYAHMQQSKFPPVPADVVTRIGKPSNGRPEADEAWAIALRSRDERDTVVWTTEIAEAWAIAESVIDGDEIGARMAFKAAYARITDQSRGVNRPVEWVVSQGFDAARREEVVTQAVRDGRLQLSHAKAAVPMLAGPSEPPAAVNVEANLARLKAIVSGIGSAKARAAAAKSRHAREEAEQLAEAKQATASRVAEYEGARA
jgi:hypothetical protein